MNQWLDEYARLARADELQREAANQRRLRQALAGQSAGTPATSRLAQLGQWLKGLTWLL